MGLFLNIPEMHLKIELFGEEFVTMGTHEFGNSKMYHLGMLIQITFLGESHVTLATLEGALPCVCPQVVEILAHGKDTKLAFVVLRNRVLALE